MDERALIMDLINRVHKLELEIIALKGKKPKPKSEISGAKVWEAYEKAFRAKYEVAPVRNAMVNRQCQDIKKRLGDDAEKVTEFYFSLDEPRFARANHPLGTLLFNCESIHSKWARGETSAVSPRSRAVNCANMVFWAFENWKTQFCGRVDFEKVFIEKIGQLEWTVIQGMGGYAKLYKEWNMARDPSNLRAQIREMAISVLELNR